MEPYENDDLIATLEELRPEPRPEFVAELDARAATGFPRKSRARGFSFGALLDRMPLLNWRKVLLPLGATALTAIVLATVVVSQNGGDSQIGYGEQSGGDSGALGFLNTYSGASPEELEELADEQARGGGTSESGAAPEEESAGAGYEAEALSAATAKGSPASASPASAPVEQRRAIERSAEITLGTEPENVGKASSEVFDVVHANRGIVLSSRTTDGTAGRASAEFELLIPSGKLGDAMAGFSEIGEVRSRHEGTNDITAPTVSTAEHLEDSQARIDSLLAQLAEAETESEREAVEAELRFERKRAAGLRAQLQNLERRASLSPVSLRIEGNDGAATSDEGGAWGIGDAFDDAGRVLAVGAGVALLTLAVLGPIALIALAIWLARRTYLRRARQATLG